MGKNQKVHLVATLHLPPAHSNGKSFPAMEKSVQGDVPREMSVAEAVILLATVDDQDGLLAKRMPPISLAEINAEAFVGL